MSPTTPSKQPSAAASSPQFIVPQSPRSAYPRSPDRRLSMQPVSRRSSNQSIKQALISRSRANSMANSRRPSRAGSQQSGTVVAQEGQAAVPVPAGFGNSFDLNNWDLTDPTFDVGFGDLGSDFGFEDFAPLPNVASYDQFGRPLVPGGIDPQLLTQQPYGLVNSTPGLTAVPGAGDLFPMQPMQYMQPMQPMQYADPNLMYMPQAQPYFPQGGYVQTGYTPIEQTATQQLPQVDPAPVRKSDKRPHSDSDSEDEAPAPKRRQPTKQSNKRPHPDSDSEDEPPAPKRRQPTPQATSNKRPHPDSDSEDEAPVPKRHQPSQQVNDLSEHESSPVVSKRAHKPSRRQSRDSGRSSESSLGQYVKPAVNRSGEQPKKSSDKPWVRINSNTKGETTRTARINKEEREERKYKSKPLPNGNWSSKRFTFEYTSNGGLDEFKQKRMSARQITEYILQYPTDDLRLWIQIAPADMARRYASPGHSKCLFEDCPKHIHGDSGTIDVGHYRVAFDEKYKPYGHSNRVVDPFDCPGFVHLYCLERFTDFARICHEADFQVDTRSNLPRESAQAKWSLNGRNELDCAKHFLKACKQDRLRTLDSWSQYPVHTSSAAPKDFASTLVSVMAEINLEKRTRSQMRQFVNRTLTPNVLMINRGDMEIAMTQKKIKSSHVYKKAIRNKRATATTFDFEAHYDQYDPIINERIQHYRDLKAQYDAEEARGTAPRRGGQSGAKRSKQVVIDVLDGSDSEAEGHAGPSTRRGRHAHSDDSDDDVQEQPAPRNGTRVSPRKRERVNYAVDEPVYAAPPVHYQQPQQQPYIPEGYAQAQSIRRESLRNFFPEDIYEGAPADYAADGPVSPQDIDRILGLNDYALERRRSSVFPRSRGRVASFASQPVSASQEFEADDPPSRLVATPTAPGPSPTRRSSRLARHR